MTIRHRPRRARRLYALALSLVMLWLVNTTAVSQDLRSALSSVISEADFALALLRFQLSGAAEEETFPAAAALVIAQSPLLMSGREAILSLRRSEEKDDSAASPSDPVAPSPPSDSSPVPEKPEVPDIPLVMVDNGVAARTLVPASPEGYTVVDGVYIDNRSDKALSPDALGDSLAVSLSVSDAPQVLIVHTHGSEAYTMPPGQEYVPCSEYRTTDASCSVVRVGEEIAAVLEKAGVRVLHDKTLHDYPQYSGAYNRSLAAVERYLERYPSIVLVLDVHRDAVSDSEGNMYKVVSGVGGVRAAQMCFVIGTDGGGLHHPNWRENLKLAAALQRTLSAEYPTLMRPITVRNSRYNQHTSPGALLVEMGAAGNSPDEALLSARLLGAAILETILVSDDVPPAASVAD